MGVEVAIVVRCPGWARAVADPAGLGRRAAAAAWAGALAGGPSPGSAEIALVLTDDAESAALNRRYRGAEGATNVLSFATGEAVSGGADADGAPALLGDVVIALETVAREARGDGKPVAHHLQHLVVHGLLHLLGYDHEAEDAADRMEALEVAILARLGVPDPYRPAAPQDGAAPADRS